MCHSVCNFLKSLDGIMNVLIVLNTQIDLKITFFIVKLVIDKKIVFVSSGI